MVAKLQYNMSFEEYCAIEAVNASLLKEVDKTTLMHAKAMLDGKRERESDALDFGTSFHNLVLRGVEEFAVHPETYPAPKTHEKVKAKKMAEGDPLPWNWNATHCKEWAAAASNAGLTIHSHDEAENIRGMAAAVRECEELQPYFDAEFEVVATAEINGHACKALVDWLPRAPCHPVLDLKKTRSASPRAFIGDALKFGYHLQAAFYLDILAQCEERRRKEFVFVAVEDKPPYAIGITRWHDVSASLVRVGRAHYRKAFTQIKHARENGQWPGWQTCMAEEHAPNWMKEEIDQTA